MNSTLSLLNKAFAKRLRQLNRDILKANDAGLTLFVEHLKYLRDAHILSNSSVEVSPSITALSTAIEEFEAYRKSQKDFHWNNFCEFLKLYMKEWLTANDSV